MILFWEAWMARIIVFLLSLKRVLWSMRELVKLFSRSPAAFFS